jgi:hypothetical protein
VRPPQPSTARLSGAALGIGILGELPLGLMIATRPLGGCAGSRSPSPTCSAGSGN